jgi:hypothetical protein
MCEALDVAREFWKTFDLNNSKGAGMTLTENGEVVKHFGNMTDTKRMREMPDSIVFHKRGKK